MIQDRALGARSRVFEKDCLPPLIPALKFFIYLNLFSPIKHIMCKFHLEITGNQKLSSLPHSLWQFYNLAWFSTRKDIDEKNTDTDCMECLLTYLLTMRLLLIQYHLLWMNLRTNPSEIDHLSCPCMPTDHFQYFSGKIFLLCISWTSSHALCSLSCCYFAPYLKVSCSFFPCLFSEHQVSCWWV